MPRFVLQFIVKSFLVIDSDSNFPAVSRERTVFLLSSMFHRKIEKKIVQIYMVFSDMVVYQGLTK